jgi:LuxR family maltose regulon positive regulatory protein
MVSLANQPHLPSPRGVGLVERQRLLREMASALDYKLSIIIAPPGYGKTTLAVQFVQQAQRPFAWHPVEERQRDLPNLLSQCLTSLEQVAPGIKKLATLTGFTPRELAGAVTNYLRDTVEGHFLYILDDVHYLTGSPAAETWLQTFVSLLPINCHLILISRTLPSLPITEMVARREVLALGQEKLRFTTDEISELAQTLGNKASIADVQELYSNLEGWPAGTVLAFQPLPSELQNQILHGESGPEALFEALARGVLQIQPPGLRDFLLASSTLSHITPELCETVLEISNSAEKFSQALNQHTFLTRVPGGVVYHRLFRQYLQQELFAQNRQRYVSLHLKAAWWFEQQDAIEDAVEHYIRAGQPVMAVPLCERVAPAYYTQGKVETLLGWQEYFEPVAEQVPKLLLTCAKIHTDRYEYASAEADLSRAEMGFTANADEIGQAEVLLQRARCSLQLGNYEQAIAETKELLCVPGIEARIKGRALRTLGFAMMRLGDSQAAITHLEAAAPLYRTDGDIHALSQLLQDQVVAYAQAGQIKQVSACLQEVVALRRSLGSPSALALALNNLGYFYHRSSEYSLALQTFEEGLSVIAQVANRRSEGHLLWSLGDVKRDIGEFDEAQRLYYKALEFIGSSEPPIRCSILISLSTLSRWKGECEEAVALAGEAVALAERHKLAQEHVLAQAAGWAAHTPAADEPFPQRELISIAEGLTNQNAQFETLQALGCCTQAALNAKDHSLATQFIHTALQLVRELNTAQPLASEIAHSPALRSLVATNPKWSSVLKADLDQLYHAQNSRETVARPQPHPYAQTPYSLRVWTLGQERIERDGKRVLPSEWRAAASKELLLYLLLVGPASRDEISAVFWPDSSPRQVRANFHTTLYRTRQALGGSAIVRQDERYRLNPDLSLWCDVHEMQKLIHQAQILSVQDARTEELWRKAIALYQGPLLPSLYSDWALFYREQLQQTYIEALMGTATCARARGYVQEAITSLKRTLQVDAYREDVYRAIMQCYADLGERNQIIAHYHNLQRILRRDLDTAPSPETTALFEQLTR